MQFEVSFAGPRGPTSRPFRRTRTSPTIELMSKRIGLVGCVKQKRSGSSPAQDLYTSPLFVSRRRYVERICDEWWILSAEHGLIDPRQVIAWYDKTLKGASTRDKRIWTEAVLGAIDRLVAPAPGDVLEVPAGSDYRDFGLIQGLRLRGAVVEIPTQGLTVGRQLQFYARNAEP